MAKHDAYYVGAKSITSGGKIHKPGRPVTAKLMGLSDEEFAAVVKRGGVKKGKPPEAAAEVEGQGAPVLRADRIEKAIAELFKADGTRKSNDDFTKDDRPTCIALNITALLDGEEEITDAERDEAWSKYIAGVLQTLPKGKPVMRKERISEAIRGLFKADGTRKSKDDFTKDDMPTCDALKSALFEGEVEVTSQERNEAWENHLAAKSDK